MLKALVIKELREVLGIAAVALGLYLLLVSGAVGLMPVASLMPRPGLGVPFVDASFEKTFALLAVLFAVALGFRQSMWEDRTYPFLLHRPIRRETIFLIKLATGAGVFLIGFGVPVLLYAWWAAVPGHHPSPFEWSMLEPAWRIALMMPVVYLGAFLSGIRPARWLGTRLLPLAGCVLPVLILLALPWSWVVGLPLTGVLYAMFISSICYVGRTRDYA